MIQHWSEISCCGCMACEWSSDLMLRAAEYLTAALGFQWRKHSWWHLIGAHTVSSAAFRLVLSVCPCCCFHQGPVGSMLDCPCPLCSSFITLWAIRSELTFWLVQWLLSKHDYIGTLWKPFYFFLNSILIFLQYRLKMFN